MAGKLSRNGADVLVYIDGQETSLNRAISVTQTSGGRSMDTATIQTAIYEPNAGKSLLFAVVEVEIVVRSTRNTANGAQDFERVIFWGKTSGLKPSIGANEALVFEARTMPCYFGDPITGMYELNPQTGALQLLHREITFNPVVQGVVRGNMRTYGAGAGGHYTFLDPYRVYTNQAREYATWTSEFTEDGASTTGDSTQFKSDRFWTLSEAVYYLCWSLNPSQKYYKNPSRNDLKILDKTSERTSATPDDRPLQNVKLEIGQFLPEALDTLLNPYGYGWCIDYAARGIRRFKFFRRGVGEQKRVRLQKPGEWADPLKSNVEAAGFGVGYQSLVNDVTIYGDYKLYQSTWELKRAWSAEYDDTSDADLELSSEEFQDTNEIHRVWRDWVLNEAGDYNGLRTGYDEPHAFDEFDATDPVVPRRRRFLPCLALSEAREPLGRQGYYIEWSKDGGTTWYLLEELEDHSIEILRHECGIRFSGLRVPQELYLAGADAKVRITASVYSDERLEYRSRRDARSIQPDITPMVIDAADKFKFAKIIARNAEAGTGSVINGENYQTAEVDDTDRIKEMAERLRKAWDQADASIPVTIPWLDGDVYKLGDVVTGMDGRDLDFSIGSVDGPKYPQIVGLAFDCQQHKQTLHLESFRDARFV